METLAKKFEVTYPLPVIVTVIEAGPLEHQVCLLVESLRRWGGRLAQAPVVAVRPRLGPKLSRATNLAFDRLNIEYRCVKRDDPFQWFGWINKTAALREVACDYRGTVIWLDGDILVLDEPSDLIFDPNDLSSPQFSACAPEKGIGTTRDDDDFAPYFRAACEAVGVDFQSLPYVLTEKDAVYVRAYWNSGVYSFASESGFANVHHDFSLALLAKGIGSHESGLFFSDQVALGLAAHHLRLPRKSLPLSHNFHVRPHNVNEWLAQADGVRLLHYHDCLWPSSFEKLCGGLNVHYPERAAWLRRHGPILMSQYPMVTRIYRKTLELYRRRQEQIALRRCHLF